MSSHDPERLDKILLRLGFVTEDQIKEALQRQRARGGRLGSNLLYLKYIDETRLADALAEQYELSPFHYSQEIDADLMRGFPEDRAREQLVVPIGKRDDTALLLIADPENTAAIEQARGRCRARNVELYVAAEATVRRVIDRYFAGEDIVYPLDQIVELPELFRADPVPGTSNSESGDHKELRHVLMIARAGFLKNFLPPAFRREGIQLEVSGDPNEIRDILETYTIHQVLVERDTLDIYTAWIREGRISSPTGEVSVFTTVSGALLDNPVPYDRVAGSLHRAIQITAGLRCEGRAWIPPYELMSRDIRQLAPELGFRRIAVDGLLVAAHLLLVERNTGPRGHGSSLSVVDFDQTLEMAKLLDFPWEVGRCLQMFLELISELRHAGDEEMANREVFSAAQLLALVWFRYFAFDAMGGTEADTLAALKSALRSHSGRLASSSMIEAYIRVLGAHKHEMHDLAASQVFLIGVSRPSALQAQLARDGFRTVEIDTLDEARGMFEREAPSVGIVNFDRFEAESLSFVRRLSTVTSTLFYAYTQDTSPSVMIDLLDAGYRDVLAPPFNYDVFVTRVRRSLEEAAQPVSSDESHEPSETGFGASLEALNFIELIQALGQSMKSVRLSLTSQNGEPADVYLQEGQIIAARCDGEIGEEAIYEIISWGDRGWFRVESVTSFPDQEISTPNDSILLEGCRRLDESLT